MPDAIKVGFVPFSTAPRGTLVVFCDDALKFGRVASKALGSSAGIVKRAATTNQFKGKSAATLDILAPEGLKADRLIVVGVGKASALKGSDFLKFGGVLAGKIRGDNSAVTVIAELPSNCHEFLTNRRRWLPVSGCAPTNSIATKPGRKTATIRHCAPTYRSRSPMSLPRRKRSRRTITLSMASLSRAIS